jgi:hypothetical protein
MKHIGRKLLVPAIGLALAGGGFAFLDGGSVAPSYASDSAMAVGGYNATNIHYVTSSNSNTGEVITAVQFTLDEAVTPANVEAFITDSNAGTYDYTVCQGIGGTNTAPQIQCEAAGYGQNAGDGTPAPINGGSAPSTLEIRAAS